MRVFSRALLAAVVSALLGALSIDQARAVPDASTLVNAPLPFPVQPHRFQLSDALFAANEPVLQSHDRTSATTAAALAGANRTTTTTAALSATRLGDVPFPTGAFWTNLVLEQGESTVTTLPYAFRFIKDRVFVSYPFRVVMPTIIQNGFLSEIVLSSASASRATAPLMHRVVAFDTFSATVRFTRERQDEFTLFLVRGSPYVTAEYSASFPVLTSGDGITIVRLKKLQDQLLMNGDAVDFAVFTLMLSNGRTWSIYASDPALELTLAAGTITSTAPFTGTLRIALSLNSDVQPYLLESASVYAVGGAVDYTVDTAADVAHVAFQWKTREFGASTSRSRKDKLLMLALPHHKATFARDATNVSTVNAFVDELQFTSIKGMMGGVLGDVWHLDEPLPDVAWDFAQDGLFQNDDSNSTRDASSEDATQRHVMRERVVEAITAQLALDADAFPALAVDSYNFGKQIGREARLLLIADRFQQQALVDKLLNKIKRELSAWLTGTNADALVYDQTFGGVVTRDGMRDPGADYGNGQYNDHHFHYGYMVYALAVVRKFDPAFIASHAVACALLIGDIGAPVLYSTPFMDASVSVAQLFPVARHKDWFVGHSYASGLFSMEVGKSQESSSECVNAYYALALFASLDTNAQDADAYYQYARLLLATELRSTKTYWHMQPHSTIYEPVFAQNTMVGVAGEMSVVYSTWFGDKAVYVHGINMIPFTPITAELLDEAYVATEFALLRQDYRDLEPRDIWRSAIVLDHAIVDAAAAWDDLMTSITAYDTWNSATNSMYWIATRPSWFAQKARATLTHPDTHDELQCFGYPACSTAGANGTALGCCATLPGCCPSSLGCCPPKDPSRVPLNACFGEHACAVLGLGCCNSIDGCCEPDPVTGTVLGCCKNQHPVTTTPRVTKAANATGVCFGEPKCAAAKLDCCNGPTGCCATDGPQLDCCASPPTLASTAHQVAGIATCQRQPQCAAAKLDCCATAAGCCQPDPVTGNKLLCCQDNADDDDTSSAATTSPPTPSVPDYVHSCHGEVACLTGGANGTALDCCFNEKGCCPGLLCCTANDDSDNDNDDDTVRVKTASGKDAKDEASAVNLVFAIILGVFVLGTIAFCLTMCYRRRHYAPIDHDLRAWYCAAMVVVVVGFFFFLVASA